MILKFSRHYNLISEHLYALYRDGSAWSMSCNPHTKCLKIQSEHRQALKRKLLTGWCLTIHYASHTFNTLHKNQLTHHFSISCIIMMLFLFNINHRLWLRTLLRQNYSIKGCFLSHSQCRVETQLCCWRDGKVTQI